MRMTTCMETSSESDRCWWPVAILRNVAKVVVVHLRNVKGMNHH